MSRQRALNAINGIMPDRIPQWDFPDHPGLAEQLLNYDVWADTGRTCLDLWKKLGIDLITCIPGGEAEWNFPFVRRYGDARYIEGPFAGEYRRAYPFPKEKKIYRSMYDELGMSCSASFLGVAPTMAMDPPRFSSVEDVLDFQPLEHDRVPLEEKIDFFQDYYLGRQATVGDSGLYVGWYYHTLFMWPVEVFGWENFMTAAMEDPERMRQILDDFFQLTQRDITAMCRVQSLPAIFCHDDLCSAAGPIFPPGWYRENIYPYYERLVETIQQFGKKAVFVCDGKADALLPDIASLWPDGMAVDGNTDLKALKNSYSGRIMLGGLPAAVLAGGTLEQVQEMVKKAADIMRDEPGYFFQCVALNGNTPLENVQMYLESVRKYGVR